MYIPIKSMSVAGLCKCIVTAKEVHISLLLFMSYDFVHSFV